MSETQIVRKPTLETHLLSITTMTQTPSCDLEITHRAYTDAGILACLKAFRAERWNKVDIQLAACNVGTARGGNVIRVLRNQLGT
jgi:hypothetical protein